MDAYSEPLSDLSVGVAIRDTGEHLQLALSKDWLWCQTPIFPAALH
jgi:hypothetical protein